MSVKISHQAWERSSSEGGRLLVLLALADRADDEGRCWPSVKTLATKTRLSERQIKRLLRELEDAGELEVPPGARSYENPFWVRPGGHGDTVSPTSPNGATDDTPGVTPTRAREDTSGEPSSTSDPIRLVWDHYMQRIPSRRSLGDKQRKQIQAALKVRSVEEVCRAIDGLAVSPHHNGTNDRRRKYLELHHAIVPRNAESIEERIDKAIGWAIEYGPKTQVDPAKLERWREQIAYTLSLPHRPDQSRAQEAKRNLEAHGYRVLKVDGPAVVRIERIDR